MNAWDIAQGVVFVVGLLGLWGIVVDVLIWTFSEDDHS